MFGLLVSKPARVQRPGLHRGPRRGTRIGHLPARLGPSPPRRPDLIRVRLPARREGLRPPPRVRVHLAQRRRTGRAGRRMGRAQRRRPTTNLRQVHRRPRPAQQAPHPRHPPLTCIQPYQNERRLAVFRRARRRSSVTAQKGRTRLIHSFALVEVPSSSLPRNSRAPKMIHR
jgi:hypothetical protein